MSKLTQQPRFLIALGAIVGALVPLTSFGLVAFIPSDSAAESFLFPLFIIWSFVSLPGAILFPVHGSLTFLVIELFWFVSGTLVGIVVASLRRRKHQHASTNV